MSCWVVPSIAAEFLQLPVSQVMDRIQAGSLPSKTEDGFLFVDVRPDSPRFERSDPAARPQTFIPLSPEELAALAVPDENPGRPAPELKPMIDATPTNSDNQELGDWRQARADAAQRRRAPLGN